MATRVADFPVETWSLNDIDARLTHRFPTGDWSMELTIAAECCWACTIRVTPQPNRPSAPDRSYVTHATGGESAEDVARRAAVEALRWADEKPIGWDSD